MSAGEIVMVGVPLWLIALVLVVSYVDAKVQARRYAQKYPIADKDAS